MRVGIRWRSSENRGETDVNKEKIYDERINPLMAQIIELCKQNGIAMVASFAIPNDDDPNIRCTSHLADETGAAGDHNAGLLHAITRESNTCVTRNTRNDTRTRRPAPATPPP